MNGTACLLARRRIPLGAGSGGARRCCVRVRQRLRAIGCDDVAGDGDRPTEAGRQRQADRAGRGTSVSTGPRVTWWGHSTCMIEDGARILTDPLLTRRLAHLVRRRGEQPDLSSTPPDLVVISHLHYDHFHVASLRMLPAGTVVAVPRGGGVLLRGTPLEVVEVDVGDVIPVGGATVSVLPADHDGRRFNGSRMTAPTLAFLVSGARTTYFAGDTGLFDG